MKERTKALKNREMGPNGAGVDEWAGVGLNGPASPFDGMGLDDAVAFLESQKNDAIARQMAAHTLGMYETSSRAEEGSVSDWATTSQRFDPTSEAAPDPVLPRPREPGDSEWVLLSTTLTSFIHPTLGARAVVVWTWG